MNASDMFQLISHGDLLRGVAAKAGFGPLFARLCPDGTVEGAFRLRRLEDPSEPLRVYLIDGTPAFLDARQKDFRWQVARDIRNFLTYDAHGTYMAASAFFYTADQTQYVTMPVDDGLHMMADSQYNPADRRQRMKRHPTTVSIRGISAKVESLQRPQPREVISLAVKLRIEGSGYFNLREVMSEHLGGLTADTYLARTGLSSVLFRDFTEFQAFFRNPDGPHQLQLESAQLTCRYQPDYKPMLSVTQRWGASHGIFEPAPPGLPEGEQRMTLEDETGKPVLHLRLNVLDGSTSMHYFAGVGAKARDRMSVVDIEFILRDPRQIALLDDHPDSHVKPSVMSTTY